jgi:uncharacterized membrane protein
MDIALIVARVLHIGAGVFWAGTLFFLGRFLLPALGDSGPAGGQVMAALAKRGFTTAIPVAAILTVLAGIFLFYRVSAGFDNVYMGSGPGITYSIGGTSAIIALIIGATIVRSSVEKMLKLGERMQGATESDRAAIMAEMTSLRQRGSGATRIVSVLLMITVFCMAIGRYV